MSDDIRDKVMLMIEKRGVMMRPRWHFILLSALAAAGALILIVALLYVISLAFFFLREGGMLYTPAFGGRGWFELLRSAPLLLIVLVAIFALILEILVRRYSFAYRAPLTMSLGGILLLVFVGGFVLAQTSFHRSMEFAAHRGHLPPPVGFLYGQTFRPPRPDDMHRGVIITQSTGGFVMVDADGDGTSTVELTPQTRLPYGEDFAPGDMVIVIGDPVGTDTIRAFGVRTMENRPDTQ